MRNSGGHSRPAQVLNGRKACDFALDLHRRYGVKYKIFSTDSASPGHTAGGAPFFILTEDSMDNHTILDATDIDRILKRITHEILEVHKGTDKLMLVGIQTRGVHLAKRIQTKISETEGVTIPAGNMDITLYRDDWTRISPQPIVKATELFHPVDGKHVVLIDDVLFTGRTIRAAMDALIDFGRPDRIELAVLVDRGHREFPIQANFVGKYIETQRAETVNVLLAEQDGEDRVVLT
jgi:pyrimidine operon attenuation protein/uracil phosphoribosyltransferase